MPIAYSNEYLGLLPTMMQLSYEVSLNLLPQKQSHSSTSRKESGAAYYERAAAAQAIDAFNAHRTF